MTAPTSTLQNQPFVIIRLFSTTTSGTQASAEVALAMSPAFCIS
jgi:hypothetical protein